MKYAGKSWSVYNPNSKEWQQTWVDNGGGYIALKGGMVGDSMVLTTQGTSTPTGKTKSWMVFIILTHNRLFGIGNLLLTAVKPGRLAGKYTTSE